MKSFPLALLLFFPFALWAESACVVLDAVPYLRDADVIASMEAEVRSQQENWNFIEPEAARTQMREREGRKLSVKTPRPCKKVLTKKDIYQKVSEATLVVGRLYTCGKCSRSHFAFANTAFALTEDGLCVMNHHCFMPYLQKVEENVDEILGMVVRTRDGGLYPITEILSVSEAQDLSIFRVALGEDRLKVIPLGESCEVGEEIFTVSHPQGQLYHFAEGIVNRNATKHDHAHGKKHADEAQPRMYISADYAVGSSGGPVVDRRGNLVGIISSTRSVFSRQGEQASLQMVIKETIPVGSLKNLLESDQN